MDLPNKTDLQIVDLTIPKQEKGIKIRDKALSPPEDVMQAWGGRE